jgi:hypothetical protein
MMIDQDATKTARKSFVSSVVAQGKDKAQE